MGAGPERSSKRGRTAAVVAGLILAPVVCAPLGFVFGRLVTDVAVAARLSGGFYGISRIGGALMGVLGMGSGALLGAIVAGAAPSWAWGRRAMTVVTGGVAIGLLAGAVMGAAAQHDPLGLFRAPWREVIVDVPLLAIAGGVGGSLGAVIMRALCRAMSRVRGSR